MAHKSRVLLIDDDEDLLNVYERSLLELGMEVDTASDGDQGLVLARKGGYNLILLDVMMPKVDGLAFLTAIKQMQTESKNGPVVILTSLDRDVIVGEAMKMGAIGCVTKNDVDPGQFAVKVKEFLQMAG